MRRVLAPAAVACLLGCADWRVPPTFPQGVAGRPVVHEQALVGVSADGDAAAIELIDADADEPRLALRIFEARGGRARTELAAPAELARAAAERVEREGRAASAILQHLLPGLWPEAVSRASALGFAPAPEAADPLRRGVAVSGVGELGRIPLALRLDDSEPDALLLMLGDRSGGEGAEEVELVRATVSGERITPKLFIRGDTVWLLSGSFRRGEPLHRAIGLRHASLSRGESMLHNAHGLSDYAAGDLQAARREFDRAIAADPRSVDALYNAASVAALAGRDEDAVALLRRAAAVDPARVQVLGRGDDDLQRLRQRADVRAVLGMKRPPRDDVPPPP